MSSTYFRIEIEVPESVEFSCIEAYIESMVDEFVQDTVKEFKIKAEEISTTIVHS